jgi:hypothetical protein
MIAPVPPPLFDDGVVSSQRKRFARFVVALVIVAAVGTGMSWWWQQHVSAPATGGITPAFAAQNDTLARAPTGVRIRVRVVNTTNVDGLAKRATAVLRERGFDVVDYDGDARKVRDTTLVLTHTGQVMWSERVVRALGVGRVESRPDSSRYLDLTVMLGRDWKAPAQPFRP